MNPAVIAVDQGTTGTKTVVLDESGKLSLVSNIRHKQIQPHPGWVEHEARELLQNVKAGVEAVTQLTGYRITAVGIDNQGETVVAWDKATGAPIYNAIVWQDDRTKGDIEHLKDSGAEAITLERAGLPLDAYFSASKMRWILDNVPEAGKLLQKGRLRIATTDAYFLDRLTGVYATDASTASRTSLMNLEKAEWDEELCGLFGVPIEVLPEIRSTTYDFGVVEELGVPVTASVVDQQAALFGHGCVERGSTKITFGTGAFALANTGTQILREPDRGLLPTLAWRLGDQETVYAVDAGLYNAGSAVDWLVRTSLAEYVTDLNHFEGESAASRGLIFVPALSGLGFPYWERAAASLWVGMTLDTSREDLCRAVIEGVALRAGQLIDSLSEVVPIPDVLPIDGGLSNNPYFCQFFTDVIQRQVTVPAISEITALGAAKLAWLGGSGQSESAADAFEQDAMATERYYTPEQSLQTEKNRFLQAVERCRNWKDEVD